MEARSLASLRSRWAAVGAAVAVTLGAGGVAITQATTSSGPRATFTPIEPCRLVDTRPATHTVGPRSAPLGPAETFTLDGSGTVGDCTLPTGTSGLSLNVTAVNPTLATFLTVFPADADRPTASNLNPFPGEPPTPNAVTVGLSDAGRFSVYNQFGNVHVIVDVVGYYDHHTHDDIYYRKGQTDTRIADARARAAFAVLDDSIEVMSVATVIGSASITAPVAGTIVAHASTSFGGLADTGIDCSLGTTNAIEPGHLQGTALVPGDFLLVAHLTSVRHFPVSAGTHTINLVCAADGDGSMVGPFAARTQLSLLFVPS